MLFNLCSVNTDYGQDKQEEFRKNELKGELDPSIFYKNQHEKTVATDQRSMKNRLNLDFDEGDKDSDRRDFSIQRQIKDLGNSLIIILTLPVQI